MERWNLVTSDEWITATTECIVVSKKKVSEMRKELNDFFLQYRDELLHGNQGDGCLDKKCKVCYPYGELQNTEVELLKGVIDKLINASKPTYSEAEKIIIKDSIDRHFPKAC